MSKKKKARVPQPVIQTAHTPSGAATIIAPVSTAYSDQVNTAGSQQLNPVLAAAILIVAVVLAFAAGIQNNFVGYDDTYYVSANPLVQSPTLANLMQLLRVECAYNFHPLTMASLWLNSFLFGKGALSFIVTNGLLHAGNTLLIFALALKLAPKRSYVAFFTALIWGVHPIHTESVTWIAERKDVLYTFFFLLSCIAYINFTTTAKARFWIASFVLFVLSCLAKGMAVVLPLALILFDYWLQQKPWSAKRLIQKAPFFIVSLIVGIITIKVQASDDLGGWLTKLSLPDESAIHYSLSLWQRIGFGSYGFFVYIFKLFIPVHLHNFYAYPLPAHYSDPQYILAPIALAALLIVSAIQYRRKKVVYWGILFFFFTIVTVLQFLSVGVNILSERYAYIPSFGIIFAAVYWLGDHIGKRAFTLMLSAIAIIFIGLTYRQVQTYRTTETLFLNSYQYEPTSDRVNEMLSNYYGEQGDYENAVAYGEASVENGVASWRLYVFLGKAYYFLKNNKKSLEYWERGIKLVPDNRKAAAYYDRGLMHCAAGNYAQSISDFDSTYKFDKSTHDSTFKSSLFYQRALAKRLAKQYPDAVIDFTAAMRLDTTQYRLILKEKAFTELLAQNWPAAQTDYTTMLQLGIVKDTSYGNRACARYNMGDKEGAISDWQDALKVNPNFTDARNNLERVGVKQAGTP